MQEMNFANEQLCIIFQNKMLKFLNLSESTLNKSLNALIFTSIITWSNALYNDSAF